MEILNVLQQELVQILSLKRLSLNGVLERLATRGYAAHSDILNALRSVAFTDNKDKYVLQPNLFLLAKPAPINPPMPAFSLLFFLPPGVIFPEQTPDAYMFAYAEGYTLNFRLAAAFPFAQSFAIKTSLFVLLF